MIWRFAALGSSFEVCSEPSSLDVRLGALLDGYEVAPTESSRATRYVLQETDSHAELLRDGMRIYQCESADDLLDFLQVDLYRRIVLGVQNRWLLHAAAVARGDSVMVLAGPSNAGKSTLCRALMAEGWTYLSEEIVSLGASTVDALRRPLHLESPEQIVGIPTLVHPVRMRDEPVSWIVRPPETSSPVQTKKLRVAAILRIQYRPGSETKLAPLSASLALEQLWDCRMNTGLDVAKLACEIVATTPCYRLDSSDVPSAVHAVTSIERG